MKTFRCTKCCNFGPGDPCVIRMDKDTPAPTFCPSDDGKYPGADWEEITQPGVEADGLQRCRSLDECTYKKHHGCVDCIFYNPPAP